MPAKNLVRVLQLGSILTLLSFWIISKSLYFPFVTGKALYFQIIIGLMLPLWVYLLCRYPAWRPRWSLINWSLLAWVFVLLLSGLFGVDVDLSLWGDAERMLGVIALMHLVLFYFILITVFRTKRDWSLMLGSTIAVVAVVAIYAFLTMSGAKWQGNVNLTSNISTLGNATYVAGVMLVVIYFALYGFLTEKILFKQGFYVISLLLASAALVYANVAGTYAALVGSLLVAGLSAVILNWRHKPIRNKALIASLIFIALVAALLWWRPPVLQKALADFSWQSTSLNARTFAWRAGWQGFLERPLLGFGYGNFSFVHDKFFSAGLYRWTPGEEYYDRAHNMVIEMLATAGILGLWVYLGLFAMPAWQLFKTRPREWNKKQKLSLIFGLAVLSAYFIHNLAVFDSLPNLLTLIIILAWLNNLWLTDEAPDHKQADIGKGKTVLILGVGFLSLLLLYNLNWQSYKILKLTVQGSQAFYNQNFAGYLENFAELKKYPLALGRDSRYLYVSTLLSSPAKSVNLAGDKLKVALEQALVFSGDLLSMAPGDYLYLNQRAQLNEFAGRLTKDNDLLNEALLYANKAQEQGGQHLSSYAIKASILQAMNKPLEAVDEARQALVIFPGYSRIFCYLADMEFRYPVKTSEADKMSNLSNCLDSSQAVSLRPDNEWRPALNYYRQNKDEDHYQKLQAVLNDNK